MLSTKDNPYNPITNFEEWKVWDEKAGYYTSEYLARVTRFSLDVDEASLEESIDDAINEIVSLNITGNYIVVESSDD